MVHEQSQKKNDRKRDSDQPKQSASTKAHDGLHNLFCGVNSAVPREFRILNRPTSFDEHALNLRTLRAHGTTQWVFKNLPSDHLAVSHLLQHAAGID
jgi:hypothetical protein